MKDIVCISMTTWDGDYMKTIVHMMGHLARHHRVLFVDYPFTLKDVASNLMGKSKAPVKRMVGIEPRLRTVQYHGTQVYHLTLPPVMPINWVKSPRLYRKLVSLQSHLLAAAIRKATRQLSFKSPLVINAFNPLIGLDLIGKLGETATFYYCYDEIAAAPWCGKHGAMMEELFLQRVDRVVVTSQGLLDTKSKAQPRTTLIKNGVDFGLFHQAYTPHKTSKRKVVGYVGSVDFRLDFDLLRAIISAHPEWDFHFVGRITDPKGYNMLSTFENVKFFGAVNPSSLPDYLREFNVGIIPFCRNEFTRNIYPLKINEYLAAGLPVVTTDFADLSDFDEVVAIANDKDFDGKLVAAMVHPSETATRQRIAIAQKNDWSARAEEMEALIQAI